MEGKFIPSRCVYDHANVTGEDRGKKERRMHMAAHFDVFSNADAAAYHRVRRTVERVLEEKSADQRALERDLSRRKGP